MVVNPQYKCTENVHTCVVYIVLVHILFSFRYYGAAQYAFSFNQTPIHIQEIAINSRNTVAVAGERGKEDIRMSIYLVAVVY